MLCSAICSFAPHCQEPLKTTDEVSRAIYPEPSQRRCREAGLVALVAHHDHLPTNVEVDDTVRTGWRQSPLQHITVDHQGTRELTVSVPLFDRSDIDHQSTDDLLSCQSPWQYPRHPVTGGCQQFVDRESRRTIHPK